MPQISRPGSVAINATCGTCQFLDMSPNTNPKTVPGKCRRRMLANGGWADVDPASDWCGDFEPKAS